MHWLGALFSTILVFAGSIGGIFFPAHLPPSDQSVQVATTTNPIVQPKQEVKLKADVQDPITEIPGFRGLYAKNTTHVYIGNNGQGTRIVQPDLDPGSFKVVDLCYSKDKSHVYYSDWVSISQYISGVDSATFTLLPTPGSTDECPIYSKDKSHVYFAGNLIVGADPNTFTILNDRYGKDRTNVYLMTKVVPGADVTTFVGFDYVWYGKDKNYVYDSGKVIPGADPSTFQVLTSDASCGDSCTYRAYDKNHKYGYTDTVVQ